MNLWKPLVSNIVVSSDGGLGKVGGSAELLLTEKRIGISKRQTPENIIRYFNTPRVVSCSLVLDKYCWLNMDSSQFAKLGHQEFQQGSEQAFTSEADVVHELKKTQVERQFLLRDAPMGPQPRAEQ